MTSQRDHLFVTVTTNCDAGDKWWVRTKKRFSANKMSQFSINVTFHCDVAKKGDHFQ